MLYNSCKYFGWQQIFLCLPKLNSFRQFSARSSEFDIAGDGYCKDWVYLPEGGYPIPLDESSPLYNAHRVQECMNRCIYAADNGLVGYNTAESKIRDLAFYIRLADQRCGCSSGSCSTQIPDPAFRSYHRINNDRKPSICVLV